MGKCTHIHLPYISARPVIQWHYFTHFFFKEQRAASWIHNDIALIFSEFLLPLYSLLQQSFLYGSSGLFFTVEIAGLDFIFQELKCKIIINIYMATVATTSYNLIKVNLLRLFLFPKFKNLTVSFMDFNIFAKYWKVTHFLPIFRIHMLFPRVRIANIRITV